MYSFQILDYWIKVVQQHHFILSMKQTTLHEFKALYITLQIHIYALSTFFCRLENLVASAKFNAVRTQNNSLLFAKISIRINWTKLKLPSSSTYQKIYWVCNLIIYFVVCMVLHPQDTVHTITADKNESRLCDYVLCRLSYNWYFKLFLLRTFIRKSF